MILYTCILRFNTIIPSQRHVGGLTALMDAIVTDRLASMNSNLADFTVIVVKNFDLIYFSSLPEVTETLSPSLTVEMAEHQSEKAE